MGKHFSLIFAPQPVYRVLLEQLVDEINHIVGELVVRELGVGLDDALEHLFGVAVEEGRNIEKHFIHQNPESPPI